MNIEESLIYYLIIHPEDIKSVSLQIKENMIYGIFYKACFRLMVKGYTDVPSLINILKSDFGNAETEISKIIDGFEIVDIRSTVKSIKDRYRADTLKDITTNLNFNQANIDNTILKLSHQIELLKPTNNVGTKMSEMGEKYKEDYFKKKPKRIEFGISTVDDRLKGIDRGDICIIAARPAIGKSALALQIMRNNSLQGGYFNLEMNEQQIYERMTASLSGINLGHLRMAESYMNDDKARFDHANEEIKNFDHITVITGSVTVSEIRKTCTDNHFDYIVIDYLQLIESEIRMNNRATEVADISRGLKNLATDLNITVIALCQLNRMSERTESKEPSMSELRESGAIEQDASEIIIMWASDTNDKRNIKVEKARNGLTGRCEIYFDGSHMLFSEKPIGDGFAEYDPSEDEDIPFD